MQLITQNYLRNKKNLYEFLKLNSSYIKYLNRDSNNIKQFENDMKEKYKIRTSDKVNDFLDNIDMISSMLEVFKK